MCIYDFDKHKNKLQIKICKGRRKEGREGGREGGRQAGSSESAEHYSNTITSRTTVTTTAAFSTATITTAWTGCASDTGLSVLNAVSNFRFSLLRNED